MTPILGRFIILASVLVATTGAFIAYAAGAKRSPEGLRWSQRFAYAFAALMVAATGVMEYALITHDFSVQYVAHVGSTQVPLWVTIVSLWSSLEGSILFWGFILGIYIAVTTWINRNDHREYMPFAIGTWLSCGAFFSFLIAGPANPFLTVANPPLDGPGPNPLLQNHLLMIIHPPMLYLGYVGMTIPFGFATAALHSAIVMERRGVLKGWTVTLIQASFLLTILGTFMTRSGVFNSVHSFTQSSIGPTILVFLAAVLLYSILLLAFRMDMLEAEGKIDGAVSREGMFLVNNLMFIVLTFTVLIGTCFPLIVEAIKGKQMSVGRPYFDAMVVPIGTALLFLLGVGPALPWGRGTREEILRATLPPLATGVVLAVIGYA